MSLILLDIYMTERIRPFLKWAGGKFKLCDWINQHLPRRPRLIEPFVGAAAVFLNSSFDHYLLNDCNPDLINLYRLLQQEGVSFIDYCQSFFTPKNNVSKRYYKLRQQFNDTHDIYEKSAIFLYLNRHGFNGLCRYNSSGGFNVPMGQYTKPYFPYHEMIAFHQKAQRAVFTCGDFSETMREAGAEDVIYCDPPYYPLSDSASFTRYHRHDFPHDKQVLLAQLCAELQQQNIRSVVSNHAIPVTRKLYKQANKLVFCEVMRNISANGRQRTLVKELLALY